MERCLGAEGELDRSRSSLIELRRKLDDSQAALHELGRENQSIQVKYISILGHQGKLFKYQVCSFISYLLQSFFQVDLAKQSGRKWADDNEVTNCYACQSGRYN